MFFSLDESCHDAVALRSLIICHADEYLVVASRARIKDAYVWLCAKMRISIFTEFCYFLNDMA